LYVAEYQQVQDENWVPFSCDVYFDCHRFVVVINEFYIL
jgi:hypothetical protein